MNETNPDVEQKIQDAIAHPKNMGEMADADSMGTVGSPECGDMVRLWLKFKEKDGKKIIDKASFQSFGCQTAIAVASVATELLAGKSVDEARNLKANDLSKPLGPLPPMRIHCGQMVESALQAALDDESKKSSGDAPSESGSRESRQHMSPTLIESLYEVASDLRTGKIRIMPMQLDDDEDE